MKEKIRHVPVAVGSWYINPFCNFPIRISATRLTPRPYIKHQCPPAPSIEQLVQVGMIRNVDRNKPQAEVLNLLGFVVDEEILPEEYLGADLCGKKYNQSYQNKFLHNSKIDKSCVFIYLFCNKMTFGVTINIP